MGKQLQHDTGQFGGNPCTRCGIRYSAKTAYVQCFEEGDTLLTWGARQNEGVLELLPEAVRQAILDANASKPMDEEELKRLRDMYGPGKSRNHCIEKLLANIAVLEGESSMGNHKNETCENCNGKLGENAVAVGTSVEGTDHYDPNPGWRKSRHRAPYERMTRPPRITYERSVMACSNECAGKMLLKWADEIMPGPPASLLKE